MFNLEPILQELKLTIAKIDEKYNRKLDQIIRKLEQMSNELKTLADQVKSNDELKAKPVVKVEVAKENDQSNKA